MAIAGSPREGQHLAPQVYLRYVLGRIVEHRINLIEESLRWNVLADIPLLRLAA
ncbi:MAG TPA: hypothetical protein VJQ83_05190 [Tepidiformaceae bacterium]|nr:hypothetical protein [Tepidiformaceae bacterium]